MKRSAFLAIALLTGLPLLAAESDTPKALAWDFGGDLRLRYDATNNYIEIEPLEAYAQNESYILVITKNVESKGGQKLKNEIKLKFHI